jgi:ribosomal protein S18 acetylase RimI-like enzyme
MTESDITIRMAELKDVDDLAELHWASFTTDEHIPVILGKRYVRATYVWQVGSGRSYVLVAEAQGKLIGLLSVCDGLYTRPMFMACLPEFIRSLARHPNLVAEKRLWSRLFQRSEAPGSQRALFHRPGCAQVIIVAVDRACRGRGVFPALVAATIKHSRARGSRAIRVGVYKQNEPSRRAFLKQGWRETPELETPATVTFVIYLDESSANDTRLSAAAAGSS